MSMLKATVAILRADVMEGVDYILPVTIRRVTSRPMPRPNNVYDLARQGGFSITYETIEINENEIVSDVMLTERFKDILVHGPVFVDIETGRLFVTSAFGNIRDARIVRECGNLMSAFTPDPGTITATGSYDVFISTGYRQVAVELIKEALPHAKIEAIVRALNQNEAIAMTVPELVRLLLNTVNFAAQRHIKMKIGEISVEEQPMMANHIIRHFTID